MLIDQLSSLSKIIEAGSARLTTHRFETYLVGAVLLGGVAVLAILRTAPASVQEAAIYALAFIIFIALGGGTVHDINTRKSSIDATKEAVKAQIDATADVEKTKLTTGDLPDPPGGRKDPA